MINEAVPATDAVAKNEEPKPAAAVTMANKVSKKKLPKAVAKKKPAPMAVRSPAAKKPLAKPMAKKKANRKVRKSIAKKGTKRKPFPYARVLRMWKAGKTLETIARSIGKYQKQADDPLHSLRVSLTRFHRGVRVNGRLVKLPHRISKKALRLARKAGKKAAA